MYPEEPSCPFSLTQEEAVPGWRRCPGCWGTQQFVTTGSQRLVQGCWWASDLPSVKWLFLSAEYGQQGLCPGVINRLLCTVSPHLDSHVLIHVREMGGRALYVHTALRLEVAEACWNVDILPRNRSIPETTLLGVKYWIFDRKAWGWTFQKH